MAVMEGLLLRRRPAAARFSAACAKGPHIRKSSQWSRPPPARHSTLGKKRWKSREIYSRVERSGVGAGKVRRCEASRQRRQAGGREDTLQAAVGGWGWSGWVGGWLMRNSAVLQFQCLYVRRGRGRRGRPACCFFGSPLILLSQQENTA